MTTAAVEPTTARLPAAKQSGGGARDSRSSWGFRRGDEIVRGRHVIQHLGGGERYEVFLARDDRLASLVVVKILRPSLVDSARARAGTDARAGARADPDPDTDAGAGGGSGACLCDEAVRNGRAGK